MNHSARLAFWPALLALAAVVLIPGSSAAQETRREFLQGTHAFRFYMHERELRPLGLKAQHELEELTSDPPKTILIVFGDTKVLDDLDPRFIGEFVKRGGALFVATDRGVPMDKNGKPTWVNLFRVKFLPQPVGARPELCYQGIPVCPIVHPIQNAGAPLFANLESGVATNLSGYLSRGVSDQDDGLSRLAVFPRGSSRFNRVLNPDTHVFAVGGTWGEANGRVLLLADHSVFINNMMLQPDTGNAGFACNCLDWLRGEEKRDRVLFYYDGNVIKDFNVPVVFPPLAMPPNPIDLVNQAIVGLERENMHNKLLENYVGYERLLKWTVIGLTILLAIYLLLRLVRSRYQLDAAAPLLAPTLARLAPVRPGLAQRHRSLLAEGNLWEPARALARDFFETALGPLETPTGSQPPPFQSSDSWLTRRFLDRLVRHLWRLAYGATSERIAPATFAHLAAQVDELKAALADGSLRFQTTGTT
jgi:hypothetical protein